MGRYLILNTHAPEECESMKADIGKLGPELKGQKFSCTCPAGEHAYYLFLSADTSERAIGTLPPSLKIGKTRAVPVETWTL
jgi:hypothetical protein